MSSRWVVNHKKTAASTVYFPSVVYPISLHAHCHMCVYVFYVCRCSGCFQQNFIFCDDVEQAFKPLEYTTRYSMTGKIIPLIVQHRCENARVVDIPGTRTELITICMLKYDYFYLWMRSQNASQKKKSALSNQKWPSQNGDKFCLGPTDY